MHFDKSVYPKRDVTEQCTFVSDVLVPVVELPRSLFVVSQAISLSPSEQITKRDETLFASKRCAVRSMTLQNNGDIIKGK